MSNIPLWLHLLLVIGATARLTRVVTADYITRPPREWLIGKVGEESPVAYWITCDWCASFAVGIGVAAAMHWWAHHAIILVLAAALTASHATGLLSRLEINADEPSNEDSEPGAA